MEGAAAAFSKDAITDAELRMKYGQNIKRISDDIRSLVKTRKISLRDGTEFCHKARNEIMSATRSVTSPQRLAKAIKYKPVPPTLPEQLNKKSLAIYKKPFDELSKLGKNRIYYEIITSGGKANPDFNAEARRLQVMGRVLIVVTSLIAAYFIVTAKNKKKESVKQGSAIAGGVGGGILAGFGVPFLCGPGAPVCATIVVLLGSAGGSYAASRWADPIIDKAFDEEVEEFSKWDLN
jgi:hypothetical protein